jgi:hypothetical protein
VLILLDFKSLEPEVLILVGLKSFNIKKLQGFCEILEVLILVVFKFTGINRSEESGANVMGAIAQRSVKGAGLGK